MPTRLPCVRRIINRHPREAAMLQVSQDLRDVLRGRSWIVFAQTNLESDDGLAHEHGQ
jgi:hypothetical protein